MTRDDILARCISEFGSAELVGPDSDVEHIEAGYVSIYYSTGDDAGDGAGWRWCVSDGDDFELVDISQIAELGAMHRAMARDAAGDRRARAMAYLVEMRGDVNWNPSGFWSANTYDGKLNDKGNPALLFSLADDPTDAVEEIHARWVEAGRPSYPKSTEGGAS